MKRKEILEIAIMLIATLLLIFVCNNMNYIITMLRRPPSSISWLGYTDD